MTVSLFAAITKDLVTVARTPGFFEQSKQTRLKLVCEVLGDGYPQAALQYMETVSATDFMADVRALLPLLQSGRMPEEGIRFRAFFAQEQRGFALKEAFKQQPVGTRAPLPSDAFLDDLERYLLSLLPQNESTPIQNELVQALFSSVSVEIADWCDAEQAPQERSELVEYFQRTLANRQAQVLLEEAAALLFREFKVASAVVQSPVPLNSGIKQLIRQKLRSNVPESIPRFMVEPSLLGGIRILSRGGLQDYSWTSLIARLTSTQPSH